MTAVVLGDVFGDCPKCLENVELEGEFSEGSEVNCQCGASLIVDRVEAAYFVTYGTTDYEEDEP